MKIALYARISTSADWQLAEFSAEYNENSDSRLILLFRHAQVARGPALDGCRRLSPPDHRAHARRFCYNRFQIARGHNALLMAALVCVGDHALLC
jgi:hypothetical protein